MGSDAQPVAMAYAGCLWAHHIHVDLVLSLVNGSSQWSLSVLVDKRDEKCLTCSHSSIQH